MFPQDAGMAQRRRPSSIQPELRRLVLERQRFLAHLGRRLGVTRTECDALDELSQWGGLTPGELGERLSLTSGSITALLDRLERLGWAARERHPQDRRKVVVRLTAVAEQTSEDEIGPLVAAVKETADRFPARERLVIERFLAQTADAVAALVSKERALGESPDVTVG
jgi:DNA-binding MarR family transcriptional regulator